jgi:hypothetical protein
MWSKPREEGVFLLLENAKMALRLNLRGTVGRRMRQSEVGDRPGHWTEVAGELVPGAYITPHYYYKASKPRIALAVAFRGPVPSSHPRIIIRRK